MPVPQRQYKYPDYVSSKHGLHRRPFLRAGAVIGQTYGKTMMESCEIGTRLAASVITTGENVCPRYLPSEFGLDVSAPDDAQLALEL